ncbi:MAG TPA: DUF6438 domain-containing protein [Gemmatimonadales bacterium]|nr:DUF6438 domain-containing protein [Gemmatimonadales bacterium]
MRPRVVGPLLAGLSLAAACMPRPAGTAADSAAPAAAAARADSVVVALERGPCFGACPVYSLTITAGGQVRFVGTRYTAQAGEATATIPAERVDSLLTELGEGGYFEFAEVYEPGAPACGRSATDSPSATTRVVLDGRTKEIRHYYGCSDAPRSLVALERRIDEVAGSARWVGPR